MVSTDPEAHKGGRRRRWIAFFVVGLLVLVLLVVVGLPMLLDVERHRSLVERTLRDATGWEPELGRMHLAVLRGLQLSVEPASLTSPDGQSKIEIDAIRVDADWRPLLSGRLEIRSIDVRRPRIALERGEGEESWELPLPVVAGPVDGGSGGAPLDVAIDSIVLTDGEIRITDRSVNPPTVVALEGISATIDPSRGTVRGTARVGSGELDWDGSVETGTEIRLTGLATEDLETMVGPGPLEPGGTVSGTVRLEMPLSVDARLEIHDLRLETGEQPLDKAEVTMAVKGVDDGLRLDDLEIAAAGATLHGKGTLSPELTIDLSMPRTPLGPALALARTLFPLPLALEEPGSASLEARLATDPNGNLVYRAKGTLAADGLVLADFLPRAAGLETTFALSEKGRLKIDLKSGTVGDGPLQGNLMIDRVDPPGTLTGTFRLTQSRIDSLLAGFVQDAGGRIEGRADGEFHVSLDLSAPEPGPDALSGTIELSTGAVDLPGWDIEGRVRERLDEKLGGLSSLLGDRLQAESERDPANDVVRAFDRLSLKVDLGRRPWTLAPFQATSGALTLSGGGSFDPASGAVDLRFETTFDKERSREWIERYGQLKYLADEQGRIRLPIDVSGPLTGPSFGVDLGDALLGDDGRALKGLIKGLLDR
jgi:hypothetical protein